MSSWRLSGSAWTSRSKTEMREEIKSQQHWLSVVCTLHCFSSTRSLNCFCFVAAVGVRSKFENSCRVRPKQRFLGLVAYRHSELVSGAWPRFHTVCALHRWYACSMQHATTTTEHTASSFRAECVNVLVSCVSAWSFLLVGRRIPCVFLNCCYQMHDLRKSDTTDSTTESLRYAFQI